MVTTTGGSRAASVASNGNARSTLKRRDKPYKVEEERIMAKKRKVAYQVRSLSAPSTPLILQY